jgi:hypothetical protein
MSSKFGVGNIIKGHYSTLRSYRTEKIEFSSVFVNLLLPFFIAFGFIYFSVLIHPTAFFDLIFTFSILSILPVNMMILLNNILTRERMKDLDRMDQKKIRLITETLSNIQFCLLASISIVIATLIMFILPSDISFYSYIDISGSFIIYYMIFVFFITLFMVLKRIHAVTSHL